MLRAGVLALAITASSLDEFDAEAWKAQKDEELKFLLKVRELAHEHDSGSCSSEARIVGRTSSRSSGMPSDGAKKGRRTTTTNEVEQV